MKISFSGVSVSAILELPKSKPEAALTLAHGAGAGMNYGFLTKISSLLAGRGVGVLRFQFPYMEEGRRMPDGPRIAAETVAAAVKTLAKETPGVPLFAAGKSFGCRMSTTACAEGAIPEVRGIICYGFPLHPPGKPGTERAAHLLKV